MTHVPSYEQVVETYDIDLLRVPGDLQLTANGSIAEHDGDLKLGNDQYNAMFRLVQAWRFNSPTLEGLFDLVIASEEARDRLGVEQEGILGLLFASNWSRESVRQYHSKNDEIGANEFGEAACAGTLFVILNNLLSRFKNDAQTSRDRWNEGGPFINGVSLGAVVSAAANNFRHHDEWRRSKPPTQQQLSSMNVLLETLGLGPQLIRENICPKILKAMSGGKYDQLNRNLFEFAKSIVNSP
jgi:hypothetical protein